MKSKIKICGITNPDDLRLTVEMGADWIGYNFYPPSPRSITFESAARLIRTEGRHTVAVGLFVNESLDRIAEAIETAPIDIIQLHGDESPGFCRQVSQLGRPVMKAFRIRHPDDLRSAISFPVDYCLLDAWHESLYGGSGRQFDWSWIGKTLGDRKVIIAGGIHPDNITDALSLGVYGIDLCSGVESAPGRKDPEKLKRLFDQINHYEP